VTRPEEREKPAALASARPGTAWDRILFSAKESVYKAWYPVTGQPLEFEDIVVHIDPRTACFHARLLVPLPAAGAGFQELTGRWIAGAGLVTTAIAIHRQPAARVSSGGAPAH
jgi:4'-phosphopantetheinyl transferase EntD